jgi:hypothetical protein
MFHSAMAAVARVSALTRHGCCSKLEAAVADLAKTEE